MATIGRHAAVADLPWGIHLDGVIGWFAWLFLHLVTLMGFRNRASVLVNWAWNYATWDRGTRLILDAAPRRPGRPPAPTSDAVGQTDPSSSSEAVGQTDPSSSSEAVGQTE